MWKEKLLKFCPYIDFHWSLLIDMCILYRENQQIGVKMGTWDRFVRHHKMFALVMISVLTLILKTSWEIGEAIVKRLQQIRLLWHKRQMNFDQKGSQLNLRLVWAKNRRQRGTDYIHPDAKTSILHVRYVYICDINVNLVKLQLLTPVVRNWNHNN